MPNNRDGFTFIEMIVAISIAAIVVVLIFAFLRSTLRGARMQETRVENVKKMILARKRIESVVNKMEYIESVHKENVEFKEYDSDTIHDLAFKNERLIVGIDTIINKIKDFNFEYDEQNKNKKILYWEGQMTSGSWIAGARCFEVR